MNIKKRINNIYKMGVIKRTIILWIILQLLLWLVFGMSYLFNEEAWINVAPTPSGSAAVGNWLTTFLFIIINNLIVCTFIVVGNLFVRFGFFTPGILSLLIQILSIGWLAGSNGFEVPFTSVYDANIQFLKVGLWEITAYIIVCAVTLPKSIYVAFSFPAKKWDEVRKFQDILFNKKEKVLISIAFLLLIIAAFIETAKLI